jgi:uncharacterized protein YqcC (DUF446 family)
MSRPRVAELLSAIEAELRRLDLWESSPPAFSALQSVLPFCCDTLYLSQWLQWILIPRLRALLRDGCALPEACAIHPLAEEDLPRLTPRPGILLQLIQQLDESISDGPRRPPP